MDNKLSELSKPVMYVVRTLDGSVASVKNYKYTAPKGFTSNPLYSQEYVSALLSQIEADREIKARLCRESNSLHDGLKAAEKRIADMERDELAMRASSRAVHEAQENHINQQQNRIDSLEKTNAGLGQRLGAAEKRLASPIKIVNYDEFFICHVTGASDDYCKGWVDGRNSAARDVGKAGFTVEGDE